MEQRAHKALENTPVTALLVILVQIVKKILTNVTLLPVRSWQLAPKRLMESRQHLVNIIANVLLDILVKIVMKTSTNASQILAKTAAYVPNRGQIRWYYLANTIVNVLTVSLGSFARST
jgi:hypothetical protein